MRGLGSKVNRSKYFNYIESKLSELSYRITNRGKLNILDLHIYAETFFADLLNMLYSLNLENMNFSVHNNEAIDLIDTKNKIVIQVSATCTKQKIEKSLDKLTLDEYQGYRFKFISIAKDAENLRKGTFSNPNNILFNPKEDIIDINSILNCLLSKSTDMQEEIYKFMKKEFDDAVDIVKAESNLATLVNILAAENLVESIESPGINPFQIEEKITFNDLESVKDDIDDYKIYSQKLDEIYSTFDKEGVNKSFSVLQFIRKQYKRLGALELTSRDIFYAIIDAVIDVVRNSSNYIEIPYEELEVCVHILVVDAFMRCKIFKKPERDNYVIA